MNNSSPKDETPSVRGEGFPDQNTHAAIVPPAPKISKFAGTDNPRYLRLLAAFLQRPLPREAVDSIAGAANGPDAISQIRDLFPPGARNEFIDCTRVTFDDRDGKPCHPGVYSLTTKARRLIIQWFATLRQGGAPC